jgi:hypothetical protein
MLDIELAWPEMVELEPLLLMAMHNVLRILSTVPAGQTRSPPLTTWFDIAQTQWLYLN